MLCEFGTMYRALPCSCRRARASNFVYLGWGIFPRLLFISRCAFFWWGGWGDVGRVTTEVFYGTICNVKKTTTTTITTTNLDPVPLYPLGDTPGHQGEARYLVHNFLRVRLCVSRGQGSKRRVGGLKNSGQRHRRLVVCCLWYVPRQRQLGAV